MARPQRLFCDTSSHCWGWEKGSLPGRRVSRCLRKHGGGSHLVLFITGVFLVFFVPHVTCFFSCTLCH